jgi:hypothetical protein
MESNHAQRTHYMPVGRNFWDEPLRIHLKRFKRFDRQMDRELRRLVDRWAHTAAPCALRGRRSLNQSTVLWSKK